MTIGYETYTRWLSVVQELGGRIPAQVGRPDQLRGLASGDHHKRGLAPDVLKRP